MHIYFLGKMILILQKILILFIWQYSSIYNGKQLAGTLKIPVCKSILIAPGFLYFHILSNLTMYLSIFIYLQLQQNVIKFGVQSLEIGADLLLVSQGGLTPTRIFGGNESPCLFNG